MLQLTSPMSIIPQLLVDKRIRFFVSAADPVPQSRGNVERFQQRFGPTTDLSVVDCESAMGHSSCFQPDDVLKWFSTLERRVEG